MQIGIDIRPLVSPAPTGVGAYITGLLSALFALPPTHRYTLFDNGWRMPLPLPSEWQIPHVETIFRRFPNTLLHASLAAFHRPPLDHLLKNKKMDLWFSPNLHFTSVSKKLPRILVLHDLSFEHFPDLFSFKQRQWHRMVEPCRQAKEATMIVTPSEHTKRDVVETYGIAEDRVAVILPGCPVSPVVNEEECKKVLTRRHLESGRYLLFVGTIEPRKNIQAIIRAFQRSALSRDGYRLVLAGPSGSQSHEILKEAQKTQSVDVLGYVSAQEKAALYQSASLFVYPSIYEGFGLPVLEAFAASVPVLTSNRSSLPEVVGNAALLVNPMNIEEIRWGMEEIIGNAELAAQYRTAGRARVKDFLWEKSAEMLERVFERALH